MGEICSERACCFLPGRDNCSNKYGDWCAEFDACKKLDFENDDDYGDDAVDDQGDNMSGAGKDNDNVDDDDDDYDDDYDDPAVQLMEKVCSKEVINDGDNYNQCKDLCQARECCFHWGKQNCVEEKEEEEEEEEGGEEEEG